MEYKNRFLISDVETGGLFSAKNPATITVALTEIAVITVDNEKLEILAKDSWLIKPYAEDLIYHPKAAEVSGISKQMCEEKGLDVELVYKNFKKILKDNKIGRQKPILIFHNKSFDTEFIKNLFVIFNDDLFSYIDRIEDTLEWSRLKFISKPNFKLGSVAEYCNLELIDGHRAEIDTTTTAKIWIHFMECLRGKGQEVQEESVAFRENFKI